jgi:hypothetical protein
VKLIIILTWTLEVAIPATTAFTNLINNENNILSKSDISSTSSNSDSTALDMGGCIRDLAWDRIMEELLLETWAL